MIKGLAITPPVIGRISIGHLVQKGEKWVPEKDDSFTLTTQVQGATAGCCIPCISSTASRRLTASSEPSRCGCCSMTAELNLRAEYSAFDRSSGRRCVSAMARRRDESPLKDWKRWPAPALTAARLPNKAGCKLYGRLNVQIDGQQG